MFQWISLLGLSCMIAGAGEASPLDRAHAHNDYLHPRPLVDALAHGFCSVEADVHLVQGELLVAHDLNKTVAGRTLTALYLEPLRDRVRRNGGRVYLKGPEVQLLIDFKSEADSTYAALKPLLEEYSDILTSFAGNEIRTNAVRVVLSGNRPFAEIESEELSYAALDGRFADVGTGRSPARMPLISDNWTQHFQWTGAGPIPVHERALLRNWVLRIHAEGKQVRLWRAPDQEAAWRELIDADVDWINTDRLEALGTFLGRARSE